MTALPQLLPPEFLLPSESNTIPACDGLPLARLFQVPDAAPPFDGEVAPEIPCGIDRDARRAPLPPQQRRASAPRTGPVRASASAEPGDWPGTFARLLTEALSGVRPARQIMPWLTQHARFQLRRLMPTFSSGQRPRVLRVLASQPSAAAVEMSVVIGAGPRTRALAVRLEQATDGRLGKWLCTDIESA